MQKRKSAGVIVADVLIALLIVAAAAFLVWFWFEKGEVKLDTDKIQDNAANWVSTAEGSSGGSVEAYSVEGKTFEIESGLAADVAQSTDTPTEDTEETDTEEDAENEEDITDYYLCAYSTERLLTEEDIEELRAGEYDELPQGKSIIRMVINEMYARYGYQFENEEIQAFFDRQSWYQDIALRDTNMTDIYNNMSEIERANVDFLAAHDGEGV